MTEQGKRILADALALSPIERAALVEDLLSSFRFPDRRQVDALWAEEAESRIDAYERGEMGSTPAAEVFERLNRRPAQ
jgi:putative addiction module component (TIGR02574 family)